MVIEGRFTVDPNGDSCIGPMAFRDHLERRGIKEGAWVRAEVTMIAQAEPPPLLRGRILIEDDD